MSKRDFKAGFEAAERVIAEYRKLAKENGSSPSPCSAPIVPLGTVLPCGTVAGVQFMQGERYYFTTGEGVGYLPADIVEKQYSEQNSRS